MLITSPILNQMTNRLRAATQMEQNARSLQQHEINLARAEENRDAVGVKTARSGIKRCQHVASYFARLCV